MKNIHISSTISIMKPLAEIYAFGLDLTHIPKVIKEVVSVGVVSPTKLLWELELPEKLGKVVFTTELLKLEPREHIGWQSVDNTPLYHVGYVKFADADRFGTEVKVSISFANVKDFAPFEAVMEKLLTEGLKNLKRLIETGEIPTLEGQPQGK